MLQRFKKQALAVYWLACFTITHIPGWWLPPGTGRLNDKVVHGCLYLGLSLLFFHAYDQNKSNRNALTAIGVLLLYASFDEATQPWFDRQADWLDFGANGVGILVGTGLYRLVQNILSRNRL